MKVRTNWNAAAAANKSTGRADIDLAEHLTATGQTHLPQAGIMLDCLDHLKKKELIEAAYLRGSLGRGHGDVHSDIDFFVVAKPANIPHVYDAVNGFLKERGGIITSCHDRLVEDYGGIGFMFIARDAKHKQLYQFDLYMAMQGVAPAKPIYIKPRIYAKDPSYSWMDEYGKARDTSTLPAATREFMKKHTSGNGMADRMELIAQEMMLTLFVTSKHMKRGQTARLITDNKFLMGSAVEMLQTMTGYTSNGYDSVYLGNEVVNFCRTHGDRQMVNAADRLDRLFTQPMDGWKLLDILTYTSDILKQGFPEKYEQQKDALRAFKTEILSVNTSKPASGMRPS